MSGIEQEGKSEKPEAPKREAGSEKLGLPTFNFWLRSFLL
jgi:hypothetical protein